MWRVTFLVLVLLQAATGNDPNFTVYLHMNVQREHVLAQIDQYVSHPRVQVVVLQVTGELGMDWNVLHKSGKYSKVHVVQPTERSLNNRFLPHDAIRTESVLVADADILWAPAQEACSEEEQEGVCKVGDGERHPMPHFDYLFDHWLAHPQDRGRLIGFVRRSASRTNVGWQYMVPLESCLHFNLVLTSAALVPTQLLAAYWATSEALAEARELVDRYNNCEDLLMNFVAQNVTGRPPVAVGVEGQCLELMDAPSLRKTVPEANVAAGSTSSRPKENFQQRSHCLQQFSEHIFATSLPGGLLEGTATRPASAGSRCPMVGFDHIRTRHMANTLLHSRHIVHQTAGRACLELAKDVEPIVAKHLQSIGAVPKANV